jgi:hypothetical protein
MKRLPSWIEWKPHLSYQDTNFTIRFDFEPLSDYVAVCLYSLPDLSKI